jgi:hypothetical protein
MDSVSVLSTRFTFFEGDVIFTEGLPEKSVFFSNRYKDCEVQEIAGPERYLLEVSRACGGEVYEFIQVHGACGMPVD